MPRGNVKTHQRFASEVLPTTAQEARILSNHQRTKSLKDVLKFGSKPSATRLSLEKASRENPVESALGTPVASPPPALDHVADSSPAVSRGASAAQRMFDEGEAVTANSSSSKREPTFKELAALAAAAAAAAAVLAPASQDSPTMATTTESSAVAEQEEKHQVGENGLKDAVVAMFAARAASHVGPTDAAWPGETAAEAPMDTAAAAAPLEPADVAEVAAEATVKPAVAVAALPETAVVTEEAPARVVKAGAPHRRTVSFMERMATLFDTSAVTEAAKGDKPVNPAPTPATTPANAVLAVEHKRQLSLSQAFRAYFVPTEEEDPAAFSPEGQYLPPAFREGRRGSENGAGAMAAAAAAAAAEMEMKAAAAERSAPAEAASITATARKERDAAAEEAAEGEEDDAGKEAVDAPCTVWLSRFFSRK